MEVDYRGVWYAPVLQARATSSQEIPEMRLTRECDYAFVVLVYLAAQVRLVECVEVEGCRCPRLSVCAIIETMRALHQKVMTEFDRSKPFLDPDRT